MSNDGNIPKKGTAEWVRNEKIINTNPTLKAARDQSEGFTPRKTGSTHGSTGRFTVGGGNQAYRDNWDRIFGGDRSNVNHKDTESE